MIAFEQGLARTPVELLDQPFAFTQVPLLTPEQFVRAARDRGVNLAESQLEGLHRTRLLTPLLRFRRDGRAISASHRSDPHRARQIARWDPTWPVDLRTAREEGRLFDARTEPFVARRRLERQVGEIKYRASAFLYSQHQLVSLPTIKQALPYLRYRTGQVVGLDVNQSWLDNARVEQRRLMETVIAVSALEAVYYPDVVRSLRFDDESYRRYEHWRERLPLTALLRWLDVDASWIAARAVELLRLADRIDPLGGWLDVVREADPDRWARLKGAARTSIDVRIAAEVLLRYHDALVRGRRAKRLSDGRNPRTDRFPTRLKPRGGLDSILTDFGLSPHPRLIVLVEGETELLIFPRVMRHFGIRDDDDFITVANREGVTKDVAALVAYAIAPRTELEEHGRYLRLRRPVTSLLVISDAEGPMATAGERARRRRILVDRALRTLPPEHRTADVRGALETLIHVDVWHRRGLSFEFAHFTDRQIANAIWALDRTGKHKTLDALIGHVAGVRARRGNLDALLGPISNSISPTSCGQS